MLAELLPLMHCAACRKRGLFWQADHSALLCSCGHLHPIVDGVPDFTMPKAPVPKPDRTESVAISIAMRYGLGNDIARITALVRDSMKTIGDQGLDAEIALFADRFRITDADLIPVFETHYIEGKLPAGAEVIRCVRLRNGGSIQWDPFGKNPVCLSYRWHDDRLNEIGEGVRSGFPCKIPPGGAITLPTRIRIPSEPGRYLLKIMLLQENVRWATEVALDVWVNAITEKITENTPVLQHREPFSEPLDDNISLGFLEPFLKPGARLLEIGGGLNSMSLKLIEHSGVECVNTDISLSQLRLASIIGERNAEMTRILHLACDANETPFEDGVFDGVLLARSLHHFPNTRRLLAEIKRLVRPRGFIALLSEPVGTEFDAETVDYIKQGINEQIFSAMEYENMLEEAGFSIEASQLDWGFSFKAIGLRT